VFPKPNIRPSRASGRTMLCRSQVTFPFMLSADPSGPTSKRDFDLGNSPWGGDPNSSHSFIPKLENISGAEERDTDGIDPDAV
jgi:hypothetical protein